MVLWASLEREICKIVSSAGSNDLCSRKKKGSSRSSQAAYTTHHGRARAPSASALMLYFTDSVPSGPVSAWRLEARLVTSHVRSFSKRRRLLHFQGWMLKV